MCDNKVNIHDINAHLIATAAKWIRCIYVPCEDGHAVQLCSILMQAHILYCKNMLLFLEIENNNSQKKTTCFLFYSAAWLLTLCLCGVCVCVCFQLSPWFFCFAHANFCALPRPLPIRLCRDRCPSVLRRDHDRDAMLKRMEKRNKQQHMQTQWTSAADKRNHGCTNA